MFWEHHGMTGVKIGIVCFEEGVFVVRRREGRGSFTGQAITEYIAAVGARAFGVCPTTRDLI